MFKKTMKFDDLEGNEVEQTFYFNYNKKEIGELLEFGRLLDFPPIPGFLYLPLEETMEKLTTTTEKSGLSERENTEQAYMLFQSLILDAYGRKGEDNVTFKKNVELRDYFKSHVAYVELIFEFIANEKLAAEFIEKCLPEKLVAQAKAEGEKQGVTDATIHELSDKAAERQADPETAVQPGPTPAPEPEVFKTDGLTDEEILAKKPVDLTRPQLVRAMHLKSSSTD